MKTKLAIFAVTGILAMATAAQAAQSDYFLKIEGIEGETAVSNWSFGACNAGTCSSGSAVQTIVSPRDPASGLPTGKRQHGFVKVTASQNTQSLRESPTRASTGTTSPPAASSTGAASPQKATWDLATCKKARSTATTATVGDLDCDGQADLAFVGTQPEVSSFSLTYQKITMEYVAVCKGKHFDKAVLRSAGEEFEITGATVTCSSARQTQGSSFGERCADGTCADLGPVTMTFTGGQMKHTKTGHVTLLK
ncbi:MAG: hypothetical protein ABL912_09860 [Novosphingobium sp.]